MYAYLGEFHITEQRSRAIMYASTIFGVGCIMMPVVAYFIINQQWDIYIPILDIVYKPWRLFLLVCGLPSLVCMLALWNVPESPKFILSLGKQKETIDILQTVYRWNGGKNNLEISSIVEEDEAIQLREQREANTKGGMSIFKTMWDQTTPLFGKAYIKTTVIASIMQFGIFVSANGMYMWFPDILNRVTAFMNEHPGQHAALCDILEYTKKNITITNDEKVRCVMELELATYGYSFLLEFSYAIGFGLLALVINKFGKFPIIRKVNKQFFKCTSL